MNRDDDFIGRLEDYLETFDGVTPLPDRVRDAVHAELPRTRQARPATGMGRIQDMITRASTPARIAMGVAAVVAFFVLGAAVINNGRSSPNVAGAPTPSPSPSPSPTATPVPPRSLAEAPPAPCYAGDALNCIEPGLYRLASSAYPGRVALDVPAGWFPWQPASDIEGLLVDGGPDAPGGSGWGLLFTSVGSVSRDPCDPSKGTFDPVETATVDGLVNAMRSWPGFAAAAPVPTVVDGFAGQLLELTLTPSFKGCADPVLWTTRLGLPLDAYPLINDGETFEHKAQFRIVDVDGTILVIRTTDFPETSPNEAAQGVAPNATRHAADQVELHQILDSIRFTKTP
jgi:hypothetical protein